MPDQSHSPEPWAHYGYNIDSADGECVAAPENRADGRRITACVNFLRGVPTEDLERYSNVDDPQDRIAHLADMGTFLT